MAKKRRKSAGRGVARESDGPSQAAQQVQRKGRSPSARAAVLSTLGLVAMAYFTVLLLGKTWVDRDSQRFFHPSRAELTESLREGRLPEWSEAVAFGNPFAGNPIHEVLSPFGWLLAVLGSPAGYDLYELLHLGLLATGFLLLALRLGASSAGGVVAGVSGALCGYTSTMVPNGLLDEVTWVPWVAWAACGLAAAAPGSLAASSTRDAPQAASPAAAGRAELLNLGWLVLFLVFQLLSLEPAAVLTSGGCGALLALALVERDRFVWILGRFSAAVVAACALAAVVLLPAWRLLGGSARGSGLEAGGLEWSLHAQRLVEFVWPWLYGRPHQDSWLAGLILRGTNDDPFWAFSHFIGLPVLLAALALRDRLQIRLLACGVPFLLLALGPATPLYGMGDVLPRLINFPEKFIYGALVFWLAAAGRGVQQLLSDGGGRWSLRLGGLGALALAIGWGRLLLQREALETGHVAAASDAGFLVDVDGAILSALLGGAIALVATLAFLLGLFLRSRREGQALILVSMIAPLMLTAASTVNLAERDVVERVPQAVDLIQQMDAPVPVRVLRLDPFSPPGPFDSANEMVRWSIDSLDTNIAGRFGLAAVRGFEPAQSRKAYEATTRLFQQMNPIAFMALFAVDVVLVDDADRVTLPNTRVVGRDEGSGWTLLENTYRRPRAFVTGSWRPAPDGNAALDALLQPDRVEQIGRVHVVGAPDRGDAATPPVACERSARRPEVVTLICDSPRAGYVVLLDEWAPGWSATVDGAAAEIQLADGVFRAVRVEAGEHEVVFRYATPGLRAGAAISGLSLLLLGGGGLWSARRSRHSHA